MLDFYAFEDTHKIEGELRERCARRHAHWTESSRRLASNESGIGFRRRVARALLTVANWLDPRPAVSVPHVPSRPALNGTLHHA
jgi:hypothetical protein